MRNLSIVSCGWCFGQGYGEWHKRATISRPSPCRDETVPRVSPTVFFNQAKHGNLSSPTVAENTDLSKNPLRIILRIFLLQLFPEVAPGRWVGRGNLDVAMKTICRHKIIFFNILRSLYFLLLIVKVIEFTGENVTNQKEEKEKITKQYTACPAKRICQSSVLKCHGACSAFKQSFTNNSRVNVVLPGQTLSWVQLAVYSQ